MIRKSDCTFERELGGFKNVCLNPFLPIKNERYPPRIPIIDVRTIVLRFKSRQSTAKSESSVTMLTNFSSLIFLII